MSRRFSPGRLSVSVKNNYIIVRFKNKTIKSLTTSVLQQYVSIESFDRKNGVLTLVGQIRLLNGEVVREEDWIDLVETLGFAFKNPRKIIEEIESVELVWKDMDMITLTVLLQDDEKTDIEKAIQLANESKWCAENAFFTVDSISYFPSYDINKKPFVFAVNNQRTSNKIVYSIEDDAVIETSMSDYSLGKFKNGLKRNRNRLISETRKVVDHA